MRLNNAIRVREKEVIKRAIAEGEFGGTRFQKTQARLAPGAGRTPEDFATFGQFVGQKVTTTAGYALAGAATGALIFGLKNAVDQAEELQQTFTLLRSQLEGIGKGESFGEVSDQIRGIAAETGVSTEKVAEFAARLIGVFGQQGGGIEKALMETEAAMKLQIITGLDLATMLQDLVPVATQFGISIERIGDLAVGIRGRFGIAEGAITDFLDGRRPLLNRPEYRSRRWRSLVQWRRTRWARIWAVWATCSPRLSPDSPALKTDLRGVPESPKTAGAVEGLAASFGQGDTGAVFRQILASYDDLDAVQQKYLVNSLAERREAPLLTAVLADNKNILKELAGGYLTAEATAGKLDTRAKNLKETAKNAEERIREALNQLGEHSSTPGCPTSSMTSPLR